MKKEFATSGPKVSVLISTYNRRQYLPQAVESVLGQDYMNFELVIVRDGGDEVGDIIGRYDDERIIFIDRDQNKGAAASFNEAFNSSSGKYICYLGDDDIFFSDHISTLVNAIEDQNEYGVVYSDLYKCHCGVLPDGGRVALAKNVEVCRDFDRMLMFQFNHVLHVSLMHRRDLLERAGGYNEDLNVLIDWDLTRKLCFYTDFLHVPKVTGQFYAPVGDCDRISIKRRKNISEYMRNVLDIRSTRPPGPWDKTKDMAVIVLSEGLSDDLLRFLNDIWTHGYYPHQILLPMTEAELLQLKTPVHNVLGVGVEAGISMGRKLDAALEVCDAPIVCVVQEGLPIEKGECMWVEMSLNPLLEKYRSMEAYELKTANDNSWGAVFRAEDLRAARAGREEMGLRESVNRAGIKIRKPRIEEYPQQLDIYFMCVEQLEREGQWLRAGKALEVIKEKLDDEFLINTRMANAFVNAGRYEQGAQIAERLNSVRPTPASLLIQARAARNLGDHYKAIELLNKAETIISQEEKKLCTV